MTIDLNPKFTGIYRLPKEDSERAIREKLDPNRVSALVEVNNLKSLKCLEADRVEIRRGEAYIDVDSEGIVTVYTGGDKVKKAHNMTALMLAVLYADDKFVTKYNAIHKLLNADIGDIKAKKKYKLENRNFNSDFLLSGPGQLKTSHGKSNKLDKTEIDLMLRKIHESSFKTFA